MSLLQLLRYCACLSSLVVGLLTGSLLATLDVLPWSLEELRRGSRLGGVTISGPTLKSELSDRLMTMDDLLDRRTHRDTLKCFADHLRESERCPAGRHVCPCCGACTTFERFACPICRSLSRHRMLCWQLGRLPSAVTGKLLAWFGPDYNVSRRIEACGARKLLMFDLFDTTYPELTATYPSDTVRADIQDIPLRSGTFDGLMSLHVLEHVPSLSTAAREMFRVTKDGGWLHIEFPCTHRESPASIDCTKANPRLGVCKQRNHLWDHSCSYARSAFTDAGFTCSRYDKELSTSDTIRYDLHSSRSWAFLCKKNALPFSTE